MSYRQSRAYGAQRKTQLIRARVSAARKLAILNICEALHIPESELVRQYIEEGLKRHASDEA